MNYCFDHGLRAANLFTVLILLICETALADISITDPDASDAIVASAPDYATEVLGNPWDMDSRDDLAEFIPHADYGAGLTHYTLYDFNNEIFKFNIATVGDAYFHMLSPGQSSTNPLFKNGQHFPIDATKYRYLVFRMKTDKASELRVHWNTGTNYMDKFARTTAIPTKTGWRTYMIDLATQPIQSNSNEARTWTAAHWITGLRIEPGYEGNVEIDWMRLVGTAPSSYNVNYSFTPSGDDTMYSLFIDDDTDPFNGYQSVLRSEANSGTSSTVDARYLAPGTYNIVGFASDDFASLKGNIWDMSDATDFNLISGIDNISYTGGNFTGRNSVAGAFVNLNTFGSAIDTSKYRYLTIVGSFAAGGMSRVRWYDTNGVEKYTHTFATNAGLNTINIDLGSTGSWNGLVGALRLYAQNQQGAQFTIRYIALRANGYSAAEPTVSMHTGPGRLIINEPPQIKILQPDPRGGADFATEQLGNPWNMDSIQDMDYVRNVSEAWIYPNSTMNGKTGDMFCAMSKDGNDDAYQQAFEVRSDAPVEQTIDASRYRNVTMEAYVGREQDVTNGSVTRVIGWNMQRDAKPLNGDDTIIQLKGPDWFTLTQDLTKLKLEPILHPDGSYPNPPWSGYFNYFRVDLHEFSNPTWYCVDSLELRADDEAHTRFALSYEGVDDDSEASDVKIAFYYSPSEATTGGTLIVNNLSLSDDTRVYLWNTSGIPNGTYWVYAVIDDGSNTVRRLAHRIVIDHSRTQDTTLPELSVAYPTNNLSVKAFFKVQGYAIDNQQISVVEVLLDGELVATITPELFNKTARTAFPNYADASRAGFDQTVSIINAGTGTHTLLLRAWDTAGNKRDQSLTINKVAGGGVSGVTPATVDEARVAVPLSGNTELTFTAKMNKIKNFFKATIVNANGCSDLRLLASHDLAQLQDSPFDAQLLAEVTPDKAKITFRADNLKGLKPTAEGGGSIYFGLYCDGEVFVSRENKLTTMAKKVKLLSKFYQQFATKLRRN